MKYTVLLDDGTVGTITSDELAGRPVEDMIGEVVTVHLQDENGNPITRSGRLEEVLDEKDWESYT